ncbi:MAG TPA: glycoside hydrolase family 15 protein, partial [Solirubrobacterales bacterium]
ALVAVPAKRQAAGTVPVDEAIVARVRLHDGRTLPFWRADWVRQQYLPGTDVLRTVARFGGKRVVRQIGSAAAVREDRRWLGGARPLGAGAPPWARAMYRRSLLVLRALTDRHTGAVVAGARDGWAYVWPRDAAAVALALVDAGYGPEAHRVARFLTGLDLNAAARFRGSGAPVPGRGAQGDAAGWVAAAARAAGLGARPIRDRWRERVDYQEGDAGDYLGNAIASGVGAAAIRKLFSSPRGLARTAGDPASGPDSAAAWAIRPFPRPALFPAIRRTLLRLVAQRGSRFGIVPSEHWPGGDDPWTAPTAWTAWAFAALAREGDEGQTRGAIAREDRRAALRLMAALRRAATPLGLLPERVDAQTGLPTSTTPLAWSHAFAILALRELWPRRAGD